MNTFKRTHLATVFCASFIFISGAVIAAEDNNIVNCTPEGGIETPEGVSMPALLPKNIPLPSKVTLLDASSNMPDEYSPYKSMSVQFVTDGTRESIFSYYEKALVSAGYRIVMWEKDSNMGLRFRGEGIDEGNFSVASYDCSPLVSLYISFPLTEIEN